VDSSKNFFGTGETQTTASVPKKTVSLEGCTPLHCAQFCATRPYQTVASGVKLGHNSLSSDEHPKIMRKGRSVKCAK